MKKIILFVNCFVALTLAEAQTPNLQWVKQIKGAPSYGFILPNSITVDKSGNTLTTGWLSGILDLNPGTAPSDTFYVSSAGTSAFITKLDVFGNFLWGINLGDNMYYEGGTSIKTDNDENVYITGYFQGTLDFNPGTGAADTFNLTANAQDIFILKLDRNGNFIWAKQIKASNPDYYANTNSIAVDKLGNVYTTGGFYGVYDFDPGMGIHTLTSGYSFASGFISKLDAAGNFVWTIQMGSSIGGSVGHNLVLDTTGYIYTTGEFIGTVDFDPGSGATTLTSTTSTYINMFVSKLDTAGNFIWAKQMEGKESIGYAIALDAFSNVYTTGYYSGTIDFNPGLGVTDTFNLASVSDTSKSIFISKLDVGGNFVWAKGISGDTTFMYEGETGGYSIAVDAANNVYTNGVFLGTADLDPGAGVFNLSTGGFYTGFILKLNAAGNFIWVIGQNNTWETSIAVDSINNVYTTGDFAGTVDFDPGVSTFDLTNTESDQSGFIQKLGQCTSSLDTLYIFQLGDSLVASTAATYAWYKDGVLIPDANTQSYHPTENGTYTVCSTAHGETCQVCSGPFSLTTGINEHSLANTIVIYPNPNNGQFEIALLLNRQDNYTLELTNALGQVLYHEELKNFMGVYHKQLDETKYGAGIYLFRVKNSKEQSVKKVVSW